MDLFESAKKLIAQLQERRRQRPEPEDSPLDADFAESEPPRSIRDDAQVRGDVWRMTRLLTFSIVVNILLAGLLITTGKMARDRPQQMVASRGDLRDQIRAYFSVSGIRKDNIIFFLQGVLTLRNGITLQGAPYQILLQGLISTELYQESERLVSRNLPSIKAQEMSQSLVIEEVTGIDFDAATQRMSVIVKGKMMIQASKTRSGIPLAIKYPYRALCVLDTLPVSDLNPYGFYLASLREAVGDKKAADFDREMEKLHERAHGKN